MFKQILTYSFISAAISIPLSTLLFVSQAQEPQQTFQTSPHDITVDVRKNFGEEHPHIQVAILLDTSSSMSGLIQQTRTEIWSVVNALSEAKKENIRPTLEIALYEYGQNDLSLWSRQIRQVHAFTTDLDQLSESLFSLTTNGGDEYSGAVIHQAARDLLWSDEQDDLKVIIIAGNESFAQGPVTFQHAIQKAKHKNIIINTIHCGNRDIGTRDHWQAGAELGQGEYFAIDQNQEATYIETPYDDAISSLNLKLNQTYLPYGSNGTQGQERQQAEDSNAYTNRRAYISRSLSKSSSYYINDSWDIIDASKKSSFSLQDIEEEQLPTILRNKTQKEKETIISTYKEKRASIKKEMAKLKKKRMEYVQNHRQDSSKNTLGDAIIQALKKQAAERNFLL